MKKTAILAVLFLCVTAVLTAGCVGTDEPAEPIDYPTALVGDWKSVEKTSYGDREFYVIYHFKADNTGTMEGEMDGKIFSSVTIGWGHVKDNCYIAGYMSTSKADYLYISEDGKYLINEAGETFRKI